MFFELTGMFEGELVENKRVTADQLIKKFDLPIDKGSVVQFQLSDTSVKKAANGQLHFAGKRLLQPLMQGSYNGETYVVRSYDRKLQKDHTGNRGPSTVYLPARREFKGRIIRVDTSDATGLAQAVFLFLTPICEQSPFKNRRTVADYRYVNTEAEARARMEVMTSHEAAKEWILKTTNERLVTQVAKGFLFPNGRPISNALLGSAVEARMALMDAAKEYPVHVSHSINDNVVLIRGLVIMAIEAGFVELKPAGGGVSIWKWRQGSEIMRTQRGANARHSLINYVLDPANYKGFVEEVNNLFGAAGQVEKFSEVDQTEANVLLTESVDLDDRPTVIMALFDEQKIWFNRDKKKVYFVKDDGTPEDKAACTVKSNEGWVAQAAEIMTPQQYGRFKKAYTELVQNK